MKDSSKNKRESQLDTDTVGVEIEALQFKRRGSSKDHLDVDSFKQALTDEGKETGELVSYAPDGGWGWVVVAASFFSNVILDGISLTHGVMQEHIIKESKEEMTTSTYSLIGSVLLGITLLVGPLVSILTNKFGFRPVAITGSTLAGSGLLLAYVSSPSKPNWYAHLFFFGVISGIGFGMMFQISIVVVGVYFENKRALATGIAVCGTGAGTVVITLAVQFVTSHYGWQATFLCEAVLCFISISFALLYRPLPTKLVKKEEKERRPSVTFPVPLPEILKKESHWEAFCRMMKTPVILLQSPTFLLIAITGGITMLGFFVPFAFLTDRAKEIDGVEDDYASYLISTIGVANTFMRILIGWMADRPWANPLIISNVGLTLGGFATALSPLLNDYYLLVGYAIVFGFSIACFACLRSIIIMEFLGLEKFNDGFGLALLFMGVATFAGNPCMGYLQEITGGYDNTFIFGGIALALSGILCYPLRIVSNWEKRRDEGRQKKYIDDLDEKSPQKSLVSIQVDSSLII